MLTLRSIRTLFLTTRCCHSMRSPHEATQSGNGIQQKRSDMFNSEKQRQIDLIPRVEKIEVLYKGIPEDVTLYLNKGLSTPFNIAQHLSETLLNRSALAMVNGHLWDMHRPLEEESTVELLHFHQTDPFHANRAFWRSCSFLLGSACESVFRSDVQVQLHSFPAPNVASGSFVYDVDLGGHDWTPTKEELMVISAKMHRIAEADKPFERLVVDANLALEMFSENKHKKKQIPNIAKKSPSGTSVTLYRTQDHVDISGGPMISNTSFLGRRCSIVAAHKIKHDGTLMYRFQGVALPKGIFLNHFAFGILEKKAANLNEAHLPSAQNVLPS